MGEFGEGIAFDVLYQDTKGLYVSVECPVASVSPSWKSDVCYKLWNVAALEIAQLTVG